MIAAHLKLKLHTHHWAPGRDQPRLLSHCTALHSLASVFISGKSFSRIFFFGFTSSRGGPGKLQAGAKE